MSDDEKKAKKEARYIPVLKFSLLLDCQNSMSPAVEVSKIDAKEFIEHMDHYMPDFNYTHDIANLLHYCNELIENTIMEVEEYCGSITDIRFPKTPMKNSVADVSTIYETIKKKKLN